MIARRRKIFLDFIPKTNTIESIFHGKVEAAMNKIVIPQGYQPKLDAYDTQRAIAYIKDNDINVADTLLAPDFPIGGELLYNRYEMEKIYETGRGGFKVRGVYTYDKSNNCIDITEIPPSTTSEAIIEKVIELVKAKKIMSIREAMLSDFEQLPTKQCIGRVLAVPTVGCPPAVPILVCGEEIDEHAISCFNYYGIEDCCVVCQ